MDARWPCSAGAKQCPIFFRRAFSDCAVTSFVVKVATWLESSDIFFVNSATKVLSACAAFARFDSSRVWYCCTYAACLDRKSVVEHPVT